MWLVSRRGDAVSYRLGGRKRLSWWALPIIVLAILGSLAFQALFLDHEPPIGWAALPLGMVAVTLVFAVFVWLGRLFSGQHVAVREDGLLVAVPFGRVVPFSDIQSVTRAGYLEPIGEYGLSTLLHRKLIPIWDKAPNVDIRFRRPIRLNLYPFRWFTLLQLTVDEPDRFVAQLTDAMAHRR